MGPHGLDNAYTGKNLRTYPGANMGQKSSKIAPKMTQHGVQLGPFGGSFGSKKSFKNETQKQARKKPSD